VKILNLISCLLLCLGLLAGCKSKVNIPQSTIETTKDINVQNIQRDTVFKTLADSSYYEAWLKCVNGKVVVVDASTKASKNGKLQNPKVNIKNNKITVGCQLEEQKLFAKWNEQHKTETITNTLRIPYPVPAEFTSWQSFQLWCGRIFLALMLLVLIGWIVKLKTKTNGSGI